MKTNQQAIQIIKDSESLKLKAYICPAGKITIGWGATYYQNGNKIKEGDIITKEEAEKLLIYHIDIAEKELKKVLKVSININQFSALISLIFNIGITVFKTSTLLKLINSGRIEEAANEFPKWIFSNGKRLNGLITRREKEKNLFIQPC